MAESSPNWFDQSSYRNVQNSEVNWAHLAQRWIAMNGAGKIPTLSDNAQPPPPPPPPPSSSHSSNQVVSISTAPIPPPQELNELTVTSSFMSPGGYLPHMPVDSSGLVGMPPGSPWMPPMPNNFVSPGAPNFPPFLPPPPPWIGPPYPMQQQQQQKTNTVGSFDAAGSELKAEIGDEEEGGEYSHYYKEWEEKQKRENDTEEVEGVPQGAMAHWLAPGPEWVPPTNWYGHSHRAPGPTPFIDHQARKALPAWLREGLEKAEQERQKKAEKEEKLRKAEELAKLRKGSQKHGKFDSDSSDEESKNEVETPGNGMPDGEPVFLKLKNQQTGDVHKTENTDDEIDYRTDEEKREDTLMVLRRLMTEILLETTDSELERIVKDQIELAKRSAQPKVLVQSSALAALSALGAESDEEDSEADETEKSNKQQEPSTDDNEQTTANDDDVFKKPSLVPLTVARNKAKLTSNEGLSSTSSSLKDPKREDSSTEKEDDETSGGDEDGAHVSENDSSIDRKNLVDDPEERESKKEETPRTHENKKKKSKSSPKYTHKKRSRSRSRKGSHNRKRRSRSSNQKSTKREASTTPDFTSDRSRSSSSVEADSRTPERYRRRSRSKSYERDTKRRRMEHERERDRRSRSRERESRRSYTHRSYGSSSSRRDSRERRHHRRHSRRSSS